MATAGEKIYEKGTDSRECQFRHHHWGAAIANFTYKHEKTPDPFSFFQA